MKRVEARLCRFYARAFDDLDAAETTGFAGISFVRVETERLFDHGLNFRTIGADVHKAGVSAAEQLSDGVFEQSGSSATGVPCMQLKKINLSADGGRQ